MEYVIVIFRCLNSLMITSIQHPDEVYQSQEKAFFDVFGYGIRTWEWKNHGYPIRSPIHVLLFYFPLQAMAMITDSPKHDWVFIVTPRIVQGLILSIHDIFLIKLSTLLYEPLKKSRWLLLMIMYCNSFCLTTFARTFINTAESAVFVILLYSHFTKGRSLITYSLLGFSFIMRPTSVIPIPFIFIRIFKDAFRFFVCILTSILIAILIDRIYYGFWTSTLWNFIYSNILIGLNEIFGTSPRSWYWEQGIFDLFHEWIIFILPGMYYGMRYSKNIRSLIIALIIEILILGEVGHKEDRFLTKQLSIGLILIGIGLFEMFRLFRFLRYFRLFRSLKKVSYWTVYPALMITLSWNVWMSLSKNQTLHSGSYELMDYIRSIGISNQRIGIVGPYLLHPGSSYVQRNNTVLVDTKIHSEPRKVMSRWGSSGPPKIIAIYKEQVLDVWIDIFRDHNYSLIHTTGKYAQHLNFDVYSIED